MTEEKELRDFLESRLDGEILEAFRKYSKLKNKSLLQGMIRKSEQGRVMSRAPYGYKIIGKNLVVDEDRKQDIYRIYKAYLSGVSLNKISKQHNLTVNGVKKILRNHAYVGKVRFAGIINQGNHEPILDLKLFNDVQKKIDEK
jgi:site-specific DNA recombinase